MKIIDPNVENITPNNYDIDSIYRHIELCGRTCYKSQDKITEDSYKKFCNMIKNNKHCYTSNVEVLTKHGWIKWKDYNGEPVAVINKDRTFKGWEIPTNIIKEKYSGKFYNYPKYGIKVTDGHNMFGVFRDSNNDFYNNENYEKFPCNTPFTTPNNVHKTLGERHFKSPSCCKFNSYIRDYYYELVGFWLGDGIREKSTRNKIRFHLKKKRKIEYLKTLSNNLNYEFTELSNNYYTITKENIGVEFNSKYTISTQKYIGEELTVNQAYAVIQGLINSDGSIAYNSKTIRFDTTNVYIATFLQKYLNICGFNFDYKIHPYDNIKNHYKFHILDTKYVIFNDSRLPETKAIITEETNQVYCVTVSTGLIMIRGNEKYSIICGNCSVFEHGTVYLSVYPKPSNTPDIIVRYDSNPYSVVKYYENTHNFYITTNMRVIIENGWEDDLQYLCEPTEYHEKRYAFKVVLDRAMLAEFTRHRTLSFSVESQRYINYSKNRFGGEITVVRPHWFESEKSTEESDNLWYNAMLNAEHDYLSLLDTGIKPQDARTVLPNSCKTEMVITGFESDWNHFLNLRTSKAAHPDMRIIANMIKEELAK